MLFLQELKNSNHPGCGFRKTHGKNHGFHQQWEDHGGKPHGKMKNFTNNGIYDGEE